MHKVYRIRPAPYTPSFPAVKSVITKMEKERRPMGTMYWVVIQDKSGNEMELHMNPWGYIRGPFIN